jgi:aryl-alcohol dehydrogenase-like predicted oxidoreductase
MQYVRLGNTGMRVSRICLGTMTYGTSKWRPWVLDEEQARPFFKRALELGINFFDTADIYALGVSEEVTGRALSDYARRDEIVLATKIFNPMGPGPNQRGLSRKHIMAGIEDSLRRLGTDYIDLYQIHRWDYETPIEETLEALHDLVRSGKVRYIGASSMWAWQLTKALYIADLHGWSRFVSMQNHYNLIYREEEREVNPLCVDQGIGIIPWSPLARGLLAGNRDPKSGALTQRAKTDDYGNSLYRFDETDFEIVSHVQKLASEHGATPAQIALAWLLHKPSVVAPIVGASKLHHLEDSVGAVEIQLTPEEITFLEEPYQSYPILGHR